MGPCTMSVQLHYYRTSSLYGNHDSSMNSSTDTIQPFYTSPAYTVSRTGRWSFAEELFQVFLSFIQVNAIFGQFIECHFKTLTWRLRWCTADQLLTVLRHNRHVDTIDTSYCSFLMVLNNNNQHVDTIVTSYCSFHMVLNNNNQHVDTIVTSNRSFHMALNNNNREVDTIVTSNRSFHMTLNNNNRDVDTIVTSYCSFVTVLNILPETHSGKYIYPWSIQTTT